jgi:hypothetical protein
MMAQVVDGVAVGNLGFRQHSAHQVAETVQDPSRRKIRENPAKREPSIDFMPTAARILYAAAGRVSRG